MAVDESNSATTMISPIRRGDLDSRGVVGVEDEETTTTRRAAVCAGRVPVAATTATTITTTMSPLRPLIVPEGVEEVAVGVGAVEAAGGEAAAGTMSLVGQLVVVAGEASRGEMIMEGGAGGVEGATLEEVRVAVAVVVAAVEEVVADRHRGGEIATAVTTLDEETTMARTLQATGTLTPKAGKEGENQAEKVVEEEGAATVAGEEENPPRIRRVRRRRRSIATKLERTNIDLWEHLRSFPSESCQVYV
jgi:hypothetical protein